MEKTNVDFTQIQTEQIEWSARNFGEQPSHRPMLGIIEELCELEEALLLDEDTEESNKEVLDAVGDVTIYMLDYCGKRGWNLQEFWDTREPSADMECFVFGGHGDGFPGVTPFIKHLAHSQLKGEQKIRGGLKAHDEVLQSVFCEILWFLENISTAYLRKDFIDIVKAVWAKVSQRDWTKNPNDAHEVAEVSS